MTSSSNLNSQVPSTPASYSRQFEFSAPAGPSPYTQFQHESMSQNCQPGQAMSSAIDPRLDMTTPTRHSQSECVTYTSSCRQLIQHCVNGSLYHQRPSKLFRSLHLRLLSHHDNHTRTPHPHLVASQTSKTQLNQRSTPTSLTHLASQWGFQRETKSIARVFMHFQRYDLCMSRLLNTDTG